MDQRHHNSGTTTLGHHSLSPHSPSPLSFFSGAVVRILPGSPSLVSLVTSLVPLLSPPLLGV